MVTMDDLSKAIILLVRVGAVARFIYCMVQLIKVPHRTKPLCISK